MGKDVIVALDFDSREKTLAFLDRFSGEKPFVKIGMGAVLCRGARPSCAKSARVGIRSSST